MRALDDAELLELSALSTLPDNQRSLVPDGQPLVAEIVVTDIATADEQPQADNE